MIWKGNKASLNHSRASYAISNLRGSTSLHPSYTYLLILPILVCANGKEVQTYGLIDSGSRVTLIREYVSKCISLNGEWMQSRFRTFHAHDPLIRVRKVRFTITPLNRKDKFYVKEANPKDKLKSRVTRSQQVS